MSTKGNKNEAKKAKRSKKRKSLIGIEIAASAVLALLIILCGVEAYRLLGCNLTSRDGEKHIVNVYPETTPEQLLDQIETDYRIGSRLSIRLQGKLLKWPSEARPFVRTGHYELDERMCNLDLIRMFRNGHQKPVELSFSNIRTPEQLAGRLAPQLMLDSLDIITRLKDDAYMERYGLNAPTAVCLFLPDTYEVWWDLTPDQLFDKMKKAHDAFWTAERQQKAAALGLTPEAIATIASIVEEETNRDVDKPIIAGLYMNRLKIGMPLQSCPTVKFALRDFGLRRITNEHLAVESPYNTYKNAGLPPGPIRIPTKKTLDFALNPTKSDYLYMCASDKFDGTHHFSNNYAAHSAYARAYQRELNKRGIK